MISVRFGERTFYHFRHEAVVGEAGGVRRVDILDGSFRGKIQPLNTRNEYSIAGHVFIAQFMLICGRNYGFKMLDGIGSSDGMAEYIIVGISEYCGHTELLLEKMG